MTQMIDLVTVGSGLFKLEVFGSLFHGIHQVTNNGGVLAFEKHGGVADILEVVLWRNISNARRRTSIDLILQTGARSVLKIAFATGSYPEDLLQYIKIGRASCRERV